MTSIFAVSDDTMAWIEYLSTVEAPATPVVLPEGDVLVDALHYLEVPEEDIPAITRLAPIVRDDPELWWTLERTVWSLVAHMGNTTSPPRFAPLRDINDPTYRFYYVLVYVAALPFARQYHQRIGIPDNISQATLADLGRNVRVHRKREGIGGLGVAWWLMLHFRGVIYQLGRLQFEQSTMTDDLANSIASSGGNARKGDPILSIHIPDFSGPMSPEACDESIGMARHFFRDHFREVHYQYAMCSSWLLDPRLQHGLRPDSNIIRFQDRFTLAGGQWDSNVGIMQFVFGSTPDKVASVPRDTSLQRAVSEHIETGGTWYGRTGWFPLS